MTYHGACTLVGGLEYAEGAISKVGDSKIGLDATQAIMDQIGSSRSKTGLDAPANQGGTPTQKPAGK